MNNAKLPDFNTTKFIGSLLILITISLSAAFAFGLAAGFLGLIFMAAAVILECSKYSLLGYIKNSRSWAQIIPAVLLCTSITGASTYASYKTLSDTQDAQYITAVQNYNAHQEIVQTKQAEHNKQQQSFSQYNKRVDSLLEAIGNLENSITTQMNRADRNTVTDARIKSDKETLNSLKAEYSSLKPETIAVITMAETEKPTRSGALIPIIFAVLIEFSSLLVNFISRRKEPEPEPETASKSEIKLVQTESEIVHAQPVRVQTKIEPKVAQKPKVEPKVAHVEEFISIVRSLSLNNAERVKLGRMLQKEQISWKLYNADKSNIKDATKRLGK